MTYQIAVNGTTHSVDVDGDTPLLWVLRDVLGMTGTKFGCGLALCGACTDHLVSKREQLIRDIQTECLRGFKVMTRLIFVTCCTGRSAGLSPLRIRPV